MDINTARQSTEYLTERFFPHGGLKVELSARQGRFVVSTKEFSKGEWVSEVAEPYSYCVNDEFKRQACGYCLKLNDDDYWTWCEECQTVFYCSERCRDRHREEKHPFECNVLRVLRRNIEWSLEDMFTSKMVINTLARKYIEENAPERLKPDDHLRWFDVSLLASNKTEVERVLLSRRDELLQFMTTTLNKKSKFNYTDDMVDLIGKIDENSFGIRANINYSYGYGLYPQLSFFNHSCCPNIGVIQDHKRLIMVALRDITSGEELNISYIELDRDTQTRRRNLTCEYNFFCLCPRCTTDMCDGPDVYLEEYICKNAKCDGKGIMIPTKRVYIGEGGEVEELDDFTRLCNLCQKAKLVGCSEDLSRLEPSGLPKSYN